MSVRHPRKSRGWGDGNCMGKKLSAFIGNNKKYFIIAPLLTVAESSAELILPLLMGKIIDRGFNWSDANYVLFVGLLMIAVSLLGLLVGILGARTSAKASQGYGYNLREAMFKQIQTFSFADIDRFSTASLVNRCNLDVRQIQDAVMMIIRMMVRAPTLLIVSMIVCINLNAGLSVVYWISIPALLVTLIVIMRITRPFFQAIRQKFDAVNSCVQENMVGIRVVKTFVRSVYEKEKFQRVNDDLMNTSISASIRIALMHPCSTVIFNLATIALYWFGGHLVGSGVLLSGSLLSYVAYLNNILFSVMMFNMVLTRLSRIKPCLTRCMEVLNHESEIKSGDGSADAKKEEMAGGICFDHVSFSYNSSKRRTNVLEDVSFTVRPGEFVAIVGKTGVGKTTLVNLIPRFYDPTAGRVLIDGIDLRDYDLDCLRRNIGVVLQNNVLFSGTIRDNLLWGAPNASDEQIMDAARDAQASEIILRSSKGLDTMIDQGGTNVSGGQRQRLCIARAMLKSPKILILDDSTSALDSLTEGRIRDTFYNKYKDTTVLLVAQRISSVQNADRIIVLDDHRISAIGTHDELLRSNSIYRAICDSQQEGDEAHAGSEQRR